MTKQEFCRVINELKTADELADNVNNLFRESSLNIDYCNASSMAIYHDDLVVKLLQELFDDKDDWIPHFCWNLEYGKVKLWNPIIDNKSVKLETPEDLYEILVNNSNELDDQETQKILDHERKHIDSWYKRYNDETDKLTGLLNRETFLKYLYKELKKSKSDSNTIRGLLFIDIDNFKYFNNHFSRHCGDEVLKEVASTIVTMCLNYDNFYASRFGNDEFALIFSSDSYKDFGQEAQNIINSLNKGFDYEDEDEYGNKYFLRIYCSIGIAYLNEHGEHSEQIIAAADEAMYNIKKMGGGAYGYAKKESGKN